MARWRTLHRTDTTAKVLIKEAERLQARYAPADGTFDGVLWLPSGDIAIVDWKSPGADLTPRQAKLVAAGWPIRFVASVDRLQQLIQRGH